MAEVSLHSRQTEVRQHPDSERSSNCYSHHIDFSHAIRILVVDDDPGYLRLIGLLLRRRGYVVLSASSGEAALEFAREADVAMVDMVMPGLDGLETIQLLQRYNPDLKVIASSGCPEEDFRPDLDRLGVEVFLAKPFPIEGLLEQIEESVGSVAA